ncbi:MAG: flagellar motor protein MotB [Planctomycetes bacterium]|nr:flagellar motor protein MotB [Planctomycetota bacterium]
MTAQRSRRGGRSFEAPPWAATYADLMSLLLVLFVFVYCMRQAEDSGPSQAPERRLVADGAAWTRLGSVPVRAGRGGGALLPAAAVEELEAAIVPRLEGGRCRIVLVGRAAARRDAFEAARGVRDRLARPAIAAERFLLVAGGDPAPAAGPSVDVYAAGGPVGAG